MVPEHGVKALIFDVGGVLIRTESQEPRRKLAEGLGITVEELYALVFASEESRRVQLGQAGYDEAWGGLARHLGLDQQSLAAVQREMFSADRLDYELVDFIRRQRGQVKTALLSNAGSALRETLRSEGIEDCFDEVIISAEVGLMKPDPAIFRIALDRLGVAPEEAAFVDDMQENVEAATELGLLGIHFTSRAAVLQQLQAVLHPEGPKNNSADEPAVQPDVRGYLAVDLPALARLINQADRLDDAGFATTEQALAYRLEAPETEPGKNLFVAAVDGSLAGYILVNRRPEPELERIGAVGIVHPEWRRRGIGTALMLRAEQRAREMGSGKPLFLEMVARGRVSGAAELAEACGLSAVRYFFYMHCVELDNLPEPCFPAGIRVRSIDPERDAARFLEADNDAFSDHWGFVATTPEEVEHWLRSTSFRADDAILAVDEQDRIAGFCLLTFPEVEVEMQASNPPLVDDLGVLRAYRRKGIGRALLLAGMRRVHSLGFSKVALAVDADNPNKALRLYESVGFQSVSRSAVFRKAL